VCSEYYYIGGYYGESTPELMQEEIMANGPIAVSFEVYDDFMNYAGGVYTHQFTQHLSSSFNPFELTNHVVVIIGWGVTDDANQTPYWIVKVSTRHRRAIMIDEVRRSRGVWFDWLIPLSSLVARRLRRSESRRIRGALHGPPTRRRALHIDD
jgi:hypothetical protein